MPGLINLYLFYDAELIILEGNEIVWRIFIRNEKELS
jgi:hypothetical protein